MPAEVRSPYNFLINVVRRIVRDRAQRQRGRILAQLVVGQAIADLLTFEGPADTQERKGYFRALERLYLRVTGEWFEAARGAYEIDHQTRAELQRLKGHAEHPVRCAACGTVLLPRVSAEQPGDASV